MQFASDNTSGVAPQIMAALQRANEGHAASYGADALMRRVEVRVREVFEAPEAAVFLVATGTAANALALALYCSPWATVFCHPESHIQVDECNAPEFFTSGAKLTLVPGAHGKMTPGGLADALDAAQQGGVHSAQRGMVSITNVTEAGTVYSRTAIAALTAEARRHGLPSHLDGSRLANALAACGASPAEMTWKAGVDVLSLGGTKNGCMGAEVVVIFDPARAWEFDLRRKRAGHLFSKHRFLSAQIDAYLADGLWLELAQRANTAAARLAEGLARIPCVIQDHPVEANIMFPVWPAGAAARLRAAGGAFKAWTLRNGMERARLVTSWNTTDTEIDSFLDVLGAEGPLFSTRSGRP